MGADGYLDGLLDRRDIGPIRNLLWYFGKYDTLAWLFHGYFSERVMGEELENIFTQFFQAFDWLSPQFLDIYSDSKDGQQELLRVRDRLEAGAEPVVGQLRIKVPEDLAEDWIPHKHLVDLCVLDADAEIYFTDANTTRTARITNLAQIIIGHLDSVWHDGKEQWTLELMFRADVFSSCVNYYDTELRRRRELRDPAFRLNNQRLAASLREFERISPFKIEAYYSETDIPMERYGLP